jgi:hypothetical protein
MVVTSYRIAGSMPGGHDHERGQRAQLVADHC